MKGRKLERKKENREEIWKESVWQRQENSFNVGVSKVSRCQEDKMKLNGIQNVLKSKVIRRY